MKKLKFIRWGGLSAVKQKGFIPENKLGEGCFHKPPARHGVYTFIDGFVEPFLVAWKIYDETKEIKVYDSFLKRYKIAHPKKAIYRRPKVFWYSGKIWTHIVPEKPNPNITIYRKFGSWIETDTDSLPFLIRSEIKNMNKSTNKSFKRDFGSEPRIDAWKWCSLDHFEFFIEKIN